MRSRLVTSRLPFPAILALRYLWSTRRDAFVTFLSAVALGAITLGVAALILSLSALSGFQHVLRSEILSRTPDVEVTLPAGTGARDVAEIAAAARGVEGVTEVQQVIRGRGWLTAAGRVVPAQVVGFDGSLPPSFPDPEPSPAQVDAPGSGSSAGSSAGPAAGQAGGTGGLWISRTLAASWFLEPGDVVDVVSPRPTLTPLGPRPRVRSVRVAGTFEAGKVAEEEQAALPLAVAESLFGTGRRQLMVAAGGGQRALATATRLADALPSDARIATWQDLNRPLFFALRLERIFLFLGVSLIVLVAALALLADLALIVANKRQDVGMLLTLGSTPERLRRAFLLLGSLLALGGTALGTLIGVTLSVLFDRLHLIRLPGDVFFVDAVPFLVRPRDLALILGLTLALAMAASFYGAHKAVALDPVEALRR